MGRRLVVKKFMAVSLAVCQLLLLCGCSVAGLDVQTLISPPKNNADQQAIHGLLQNGQADVTFVYPKSGEYRSAITIRDLAGDGGQEAIGFVLLENAVEVKFLVKTEGVWRLKTSFSNPVTQVDRICFGDVNGDGRDEVIIGWGNTQNLMSANVCVYFDESTGVVEVPLDQKYGDMVLTDLDGDGIQELFLLQRQMIAEDETAESVPARAELISLKNARETGKADSISTVEADNSITKFVSILTGNIRAKHTGIVADGAKADNSMTTQIFFLNDGGRLEAFPKNVNDEGMKNPFFRPAGTNFTAKDINGDGVIDIPVVTVLPVISTGTTVDSAGCLVEWSDYSPSVENGYFKVMSALMNPTEGYWFSPAEYMKNSITAINDTKMHSVTYYDVQQPEEEGTEPRMGSILFSIRVFSETAWQQRGLPRGYEMLAAQNGRIFGIYVSTADVKYTMLIDRVKYSFQIIND